MPLTVIWFRGDAYKVEYGIEPPPWTSHREGDPRPQYYITGATKYKQVGFLADDTAEKPPTVMPLGASFYFPIIDPFDNKEAFDEAVRHRVTAVLLDQYGPRRFATKSYWVRDRVRDLIYPNTPGARIWKVDL